MSDQMTTSQDQHAMDRVDDLAYELAEALWRPTFNTMAKAAGVRDDAIEAAWVLSGINPTGQPNEAVISDAIKAQMATKSFLFSETAVAASKQPSVEIIENDDPRWSDATWQVKNQDKVQASARAKIARGDFD